MNFPSANWIGNYTLFVSSIISEMKLGLDFLSF